MEKDNKDYIKSVEALIKDLISQLRASPSSTSTILPAIYALLGISNIDPNLLAEVDDVVKSNYKKMSLLTEAAKQKADELTEVQRGMIADFYKTLDECKNTLNEVKPFLESRKAAIDKEHEAYIKAHGTDKEAERHEAYKDCIFKSHEAIIEKKVHIHKTMNEKKAELQSKHDKIEKDPSMKDYLTALRKEVDNITEQSKKEMRECDNYIEGPIKRFVIAKRVFDDNPNKSFEENNQFVDQVLEQPLPKEQQRLIQDYIRKFYNFSDSKRKDELNDVITQLEEFYSLKDTKITFVSKAQANSSKPLPSKVEALEAAREKEKDLTVGRNL